MTKANSARGTEVQREKLETQPAIDGELLRLVHRILDIEGQRVRQQRELFDYLVHHPDSQIPHVSFRL
jgi:hypothetical protein